MLKISFFTQCPRCGHVTFENLDSYSHCVNCFYSEDHWHDSEIDYFEAKDSENFFSPTPIVPLSKPKQKQFKKTGS